MKTLAYEILYQIKSSAAHTVKQDSLVCCYLSEAEEILKSLSKDLEAYQQQDPQSCISVYWIEYGMDGSIRDYRTLNLPE